MGVILRDFENILGGLFLIWRYLERPHEIFSSPEG